MPPVSFIKYLSCLFHEVRTFLREIPRFSKIHTEVIDLDRTGVHGHTDGLPVTQPSCLLPTLFLELPVQVVMLRLRSGIPLERRQKADGIEPFRHRLPAELGSGGHQVTEVTDVVRN